MQFTIDDALDKLVSSVPSAHVIGNAPIPAVLPL
jgi:hypothetical protein